MERKHNGVMHWLCRPCVLGFIFHALVIAPIGTARAVPITVDLGTHGTLSPDRTFTLNEISGTALNGQNLAIDIRFADAKFVRLFSITSDDFGVLLRFNTDHAGLVGFLEGTGFFVDADGNSLHTPQTLGSASSSSGFMAVGLFPISSGELHRPYDFYGIHLDLILPSNPSVSVTDLQFQLVSGPFGVGPGLPPDIVSDQGRTLPLLGCALIALALIGFKRVGRPTTQLTARNARAWTQSMKASS
jgi:hypothetical protein